MKFKVLLEDFQINDFIKDYLDYFWEWLGAGKRQGGLSGNSAAQKRSDNLYEIYDDYVDVYGFEEFIQDVYNKHLNELDTEHPELKKYEGTKLHHIKSAPFLFDKMKKFLVSNGVETVKKFVK
jgi:hypothetical protein